MKFIDTLSLFLLSIALQAQQSVLYVYQTYDGDTYRVSKTYRVGDTAVAPLPFSKSYTVRLYGADTPEGRTPYVAQEQKYSREASAAVRVLMTGTFIVADSIGIDQYNRPVLSVKISDGRDLASLIAAEGWGWPYFPEWPSKPTAAQRSYRDFMESLNRSAKSEKKGIWSQRGRPVKPSTWRKNHAGMQPAHP